MSGAIGDSYSIGSLEPFSRFTSKPTSPLDYKGTTDNFSFVQPPAYPSQFSPDVVAEQPADESSDFEIADSSNSSSPNSNVPSPKAVNHALH